MRHAKTTIKTDTTHISLQFCRDYHWGGLVNALHESRTKSFPHRLGGVFIEVARAACVLSLLTTFPYILYGLSLRPMVAMLDEAANVCRFPFLFGRAFIEARMFRQPFYGA